MRRSAEGRAVQLPGEHTYRRRRDHTPGRRLFQGRTRGTGDPIREGWRGDNWRLRSQVVSSFTIIKGSLIEETYAAFEAWDFSLCPSRRTCIVCEDETSSARRARAGLRDVAKVLNRRFEPGGETGRSWSSPRAAATAQIWKPLLLWHMTRDEFLVRDFLECTGSTAVR